MASKKPGKRPERKKPVQKDVPLEPAAQNKAVEPKAIRKEPGAPKKLPEVKAAVRVTKKNVKTVKPTSKSPALPPDSATKTQTARLAGEPAPVPVQPAVSNVADSQQTAAEACPPQFARQVTHDEIRHLAYLKWEAAGRPHGDGGHFWWEAERELMQHS